MFLIKHTALAIGPATLMFMFMFPSIMYAAVIEFLASCQAGLFGCGGVGEALLCLRSYIHRTILRPDGARDK